MTISYNWLNEYLPEKIAPEALSKILTSIGLEVESMEPYESIKGSLKGLVVGEVLSCRQHPNADRLKLTMVDTGSGEPLQIVCGAPNVAAGQKVIVATIGTTIYPANGEPVTMKPAKIRGEESRGMICAEDEIGLGNNHSGIMILTADAQPGTPAADYFDVYTDTIYEIGLTPNRMDAMSHIGVARDVCAYLSHHQQRQIQPLLPATDIFTTDNNDHPITVAIENITACRRYSGVSISNITIGPSPAWLQNRLKAIGIRSINNIVDITNFVLHETGQPLHAFDADAITGNAVIVKNVPQDTAFVTLDGRERKLNEEDLMICNVATGMCIAGVFGGAASGVKDGTTRIFLESAWFNPAAIRKTAFAHDLRTDAAAHFEKGVDISNTVYVLKRAALLIKAIAGGAINSPVVDVYPQPQPKTAVTLPYNFLKKLSGKTYAPAAVKTILHALSFDTLEETTADIKVAVPYSKLDISSPADVVEEILRIDGIDNIPIPVAITLSPARETLGTKDSLQDKIARQLTGLGFCEIVTNSIVSSGYYETDTLGHTVKMINSLSADLDVLRPSMLETGLEAIAYNLNRKNNHLRFFEFGKTYRANGIGDYTEQEHLSLYITGSTHEDYWGERGRQQSFYDIKGYTAALLKATGITDACFEKNGIESTANLNLVIGSRIAGIISEVAPERLKQFDIKQPVYFADIDFGILLSAVEAQTVIYKEVPRYPVVQRDLSVVISKTVNYSDIEATISKLKLSRLTGTRLFDVFENEKLGSDKKSMAVSFTFGDEEKTLTDAETDNMMGRIARALEQELGAGIRKA